MTGWISLHRSIEDHWTFKEKRTFSKFEAWIDLLLMVNHKDNKVLLGNELVTVQRGQKITSIRKLCDRWSWSNNKVKNFLNLLEDDGMLIVKSDTKKTVLTIVNYDLYQNEDLKKRHQSDSEATPKRHDGDTEASRTHTNNNDNNANNELIMSNNDNNSQSVGVIFDKYAELGFGTINAYKAEQIQEWLKIFEPDVIIKSLEVASNNNKATMNYVNGILNNWKQRGLTTLKKVEDEERKKQVEQFKPSYHQKMRERPGEKAPDWMNKDEKPPPDDKPLKTAAEDPELQKIIENFRNAK